MSNENQITVFTHTKINDCEVWINQLANDKAELNMESGIVNSYFSLVLTLDELRKLRSIINKTIMKMTFKTTTK